MFQISGEQIFKCDRSKENDDGRSGIIGGLRLQYFLNGLSNNIDASYDDNNSNHNGSDAFNAITVNGEFLMIT